MSQVEDAQYTGGPMLPIELEVARGLRFAHLMALAVQRQEKVTARLVEELGKLLVAKSITDETEWEETLDHRRMP